LDSFESLVRRIDAHPMYQMSKGAQELFHSNFIAWLLNTDAEVLDLIFGPFIGATAGTANKRSVEARREVKHLDVVVYDGGKPILAVENKVKGLVDDHQLDGYSRALESLGNPAAVILSLAEPGWTGRGRSHTNETVREVATHGLRQSGRVPSTSSRRACRRAVLRTSMFSLCVSM